MNLTEAISAIPLAVRRAIYLGVIFASVLFSAAGVFVGASPWPTPWWVNAGLQTLGYLGGLFGIVAIANTPKAETAPDRLPDDSDDDGVPPLESVSD